MDKRTVLAGLLLAACGDMPTDADPGSRGGEVLIERGVAAETRSAAPTSGLPDYFDCLDREGITLVSAHRGTDGRMPENGLASIQSVVARTGGLVEVDVATSADGVLYLHHDDTLDRTTTGQGPADASWSIIKGLSLRDEDGRVTAQSPTTLKELLEWSEGRAIPQLDIKLSTDYDDVAAVLRDTGAEARVVVISYSPGQARLIARKMPRVMISVTVREVGDLDRLARDRVPLDRVLAWTGNEAPDPALYDAMEARGVEVIFGTLGGRDSLDEQILASGDDGAYAALAGQGVDVLGTDRPVEAASALRAAGVRTDGGVCLAG